MFLYTVDISFFVRYRYRPVTYRYRYFDRYYDLYLDCYRYRKRDRYSKRSSPFYDRLWFLFAIPMIYGHLNDKDCYLLIF
jgi:hypothetical protein